MSILIVAVTAIAGNTSAAAQLCDQADSGAGQALGIDQRAQKAGGGGDGLDDAAIEAFDRHGCYVTGRSRNNSRYPLPDSKT